MRQGYIITGTDTDIGKTIFSAALVGALNGHYWKPVQAGLDGGGDAETVRQLSGLADDRILAEAYRLTTPCSPHQAAKIDGVEIDRDALSLPEISGPLVVEGAGGALVPLSDDWLYADQFARWNMPIIIVARTGLGTINHSLLTIEALRARGLTIHGIAFVGRRNLESERTIAKIGNIRNLGCLPMMDILDSEILQKTFSKSFEIRDFL